MGEFRARLNAVSGRAWAAARRLVDRVAGGFWFVPTLTTLGLTVLALLVVRFDDAGGLTEAALALSLGADGARAVLSVIAGGMMTVASIVFSLVFVALTSMSAQLGPRILLFFMHDRTTQMVMGVFVGTFMFALIGLLSAQDDATPPAAAVLGAMALAAVAFGAMIYFVHHIALSMQADVLVTRLGAQLRAAVERIATGADPSDEGPAVTVDRRPTEEALAVFQRSADPGTLCATRAGYVQRIDATTLARAAAEAKVRLVLLVRSAAFVIEGAPLLRVVEGVEAEARSGAALSDAVPAGLVAQAITLGSERSPAQEAHFEVSALAEVAVRALSPGVNDPNTAIACVHRLTDGLALIARRGVAGDQVHSIADAPRLWEPRRDFADFLDLAFAPIRAHARDDAQVSAAILEAYDTLADVVERPRDRRALAEALSAMRESIDRFTESRRDREALLARADDISHRNPVDG